MGKTKEIISLKIGQLRGHPANANRMSKSSFGKLVSHIRRTGNYEPVVVRSPEGDRGNYQILNGHHRVKALEQLGYDSVDCVVWDVDDDEALVLLSTLNRLCGGDDVYKKSAIIKTLSEKYSTTELVKMLPANKKNIDRLRDLSAKIEFTKQIKAFLNPVTFFLNDGQKEIFDAAIAKAIDDDAVKTSAQRRADAVVRIAEFFIGEVKDEKSN